MKQRITPSQLQELSEEQKEKLREWWKEYKDEGDMFTCFEDEFLEGKEFCLSHDKKSFYNSLPLLSVGQMIEILHSQMPITISCEYNPKIYTVITSYDASPEGEEGIYWGDDEEYEAKELVDALWEVVKAVL